jgi:type 1 glutamine amidotransferase
VVYIALGHDMRAWGEPSFRALVRQALQWTAKVDA